MLLNSPSYAALKALVQRQENNIALNRPARVVTAENLRLDLTRTLVNDDIFSTLCKIPEECGFNQKRRRLLSGAIVNDSENRAAWHTRLRQEPYAPDIEKTHRQMERIINECRQRGVTDVVNIGIGGSDLGLRLVVDALQDFKQPDAPRIHFVHNVDPAVFNNVVKHLNPETTIFIISSKSFGTEETLSNAEAARQWLGAFDARKFYAVTSHAQRALDWGVQESHILEMPLWVGGRFSLWSAAGLPIAFMLGMEQFKDLLHGAQRMDRHFEMAPVAENMPVILALLTILHRNICNYPAEAFVPYAQSLSHLPDYLQQLIMESNGKQAALDTAPVVFGGVGTNSQHSFFQFLHQGTGITPVTIILPFHGLTSGDRHMRLIANALAQANALADNQRPCMVLTFNQLNPENLGMVLALYEHVVFVQGALWGINSFDQPGVELGKRLAQFFYPFLAGAELPDSLDPSTASLIQHYKIPPQ